MSSVPPTFTGFFVTIMGGYKFHLIKKLRDSSVDENFIQSKAALIIKNQPVSQRERLEIFHKLKQILFQASLLILL